jgi:Spy/CpxP family protein refolding chaperone
MSIEVSKKSVRVFAALILLATFIVGAAAGAGIWHMAVSKQVFGPPPMNGPFPFHQLDLSPEQEAQAQTIIEKYKPELDEIIKPTFPKVREIREKIDEELIQILTPEQKRRFGDIKARLRGPGRPPGKPHGKMIPLPMGGPPGAEMGPAPQGDMIPPPPMEHGPMDNGPKPPMNEDSTAASKK